MFEITLVQKVKKQIEAPTPAEALEIAMGQIKEAADPFEPSGWTIKEKADEA